MIEECEAKYVKDIFMMYLAGKNTGEISDYLEEHHVLTKDVLYSKKRKCSKKIKTAEKTQHLVLFPLFSYYLTTIQRKMVVMFFCCFYYHLPPF